MPYKQQSIVNKHRSNMSNKEAQARIKSTSYWKNQAGVFLATNTAKPISALKPTAN